MKEYPDKSTLSSALVLQQENRVRLTALVNVNNASKGLYYGLRKGKKKKLLIVRMHTHLIRL